MGVDPAANRAPRRWLPAHARPVISGRFGVSTATGAFVALVGLFVDRKCR